jgi:hypothetical protein
MFADEASVIKGRCAYEVWKVRRQCNMGSHPKEQHGIGVLVWATVAQTGCRGCLPESPVAQWRYVHPYADQ